MKNVVHNLKGHRNTPGAQVRWKNSKMRKASIFCQQKFTSFSN